ncbi:MAG: FkbM family methyltransferase [Rhodanobacter sp.]|nr:FkbM family methyltransferase [Rhodanobacter sp.]
MLETGTSALGTRAEKHGGRPFLGKAASIHAPGLQQLAPGLVLLFPSPITDFTMNTNHQPVDNSRRLWNTRYGVMAAMNQDNPIVQSLRQYGEWIEQELDILGSFLQEGQVVVEFGGEYAAHALWLAKAVGDQGRVIVAEPRRIEFQQLCANLALNGLGNVHAEAMWLGRQSGFTSLGELFPESSASQTERVRTSTLDEQALDELHLLKINLPGAAAALLAGAHETVRRCRPIIYLRLASIGQAVTDISALKELGYRCWSHLPFMFNKDNFAGSTDNNFPGCVHQNIIAAPIEGRQDFDRLQEI